MASIRDNKGKPAPGDPRVQRWGQQTKADPEEMSKVDKIRLARRLAEKGKKKPYIKKKTGLDRDEVDAVVAAVRGVDLRRSHREILTGNLRRFRKLVPLAQAAYEDKPHSHNAASLSTISGEIRSIMAHLDDLARPETLALEVIQGVFQPFIRDVMRETVRELRRSKARAIAVAESPEAARAIGEAYDSLGRALGVAMKEKYGEYAEKLGITLQCDLDELRKLSTESKAELANMAEETQSNVIPISSGGRR